MTTADVIADAKRRMEGAVESVQEDFGAIRTGRANPQILHKLSIDYYGNPTPLQQLASFSVPEPRMLIVSPFDQSTVSDIEKAIREADVGLNPSTDGSIVRCVFPELTEERRKEFIKMAKTRAEEGRVSVRNVRRHAKDEINKMESEGDVGGDDHDRALKQLDDLTHAQVAEIDKLLANKEQDLLEV